MPRSAVINTDSHNRSSCTRKYHEIGNKINPYLEISWNIIDITCVKRFTEFVHVNCDIIGNKYFNKMADFELSIFFLSRGHHIVKQYLNEKMSSIELWIWKTAHFHLRYWNSFRMFYISKNSHCSWNETEKKREFVSTKAHTK